MKHLRALFALGLILTFSTSVFAQDAEEVETPPPPPVPVEYSGAHILIQYQGSARAPETITRTKEEAFTLCEEVAAKAKAGEDFAELAKQYSEGPSGARGGDLGSWEKGRMIPEFDAAIELLEVGGISDPIETAFGYHVILRKKVEMVSCKHILVMHADSERGPAEITRTLEEAKARAEECLAKVEAGESFETLAAEYSDGPTSTRGGDLGRFGKGMMHPAFEAAAFGLDVGGKSGLVETPFGYHIIYRYD